MSESAIRLSEGSLGKHLRREVLCRIRRTECNTECANGKVHMEPTFRIALFDYKQVRG